MILLPSDLSSLHRWEIAEYVAEGFVILGCAGEAVALIRRIPRRFREQIETWSTIVLVLALTIGLKCLIKTNELSGMVIGSLGETAEQADNKAKAAIGDSSTALLQAKDALNRARAAQRSLEKAEGEAKSAQIASSSALTLARGARQEADSFEKDIRSAQKQAAEVFGQMLDREITPDQRDKMLSVLRTRPPGKIIVQSILAGGRESLQYGNRIADVFMTAHWEVTPPNGRGSFEAPVFGVVIIAGANSDEISDFVAQVLIAGEVAKKPVPLMASKNVENGAVEIWVASREPIQKR